MLSLGLIAVVWYGAAAVRAPEPGPALWNALVDAYDAGDYETAITLARRGQTLEPAEVRFLAAEGYSYYRLAESLAARGENGAGLYASSGEAMLRAAARAHEAGSPPEQLLEYYRGAASAYYRAGDRLRALEAVQRGLALGYSEHLDAIVQNIQWEYVAEGNYEAAVELARLRQQAAPGDWRPMEHEARILAGWAAHVAEGAGPAAALPYYLEAGGAYERAVAAAEEQGAPPRDLALLHYYWADVLQQAADGTAGSLVFRDQSLQHFRLALAYNADGAVSMPWAYFFVADDIYSRSPVSDAAQEYFALFLLQYDGDRADAAEYARKAVQTIAELQRKLYGDPGVPRVVTEHAVWVGYGVGRGPLQAYAEAFEQRILPIVQRETGLRAGRWPVVVNVYGDRAAWDAGAPCVAGTVGCYTWDTRQVHIAHWRTGRMVPELVAHEYVHWLMHEEAGLREGPEWLHEGVAELVAARVGADMARPDAVPGASDGLAADWRAVVGSSLAPEQGLTRWVEERVSYAYAHTAVAHLIETRGAESLHEFLRLGRAGYPLPDAFRQAFGTTLDDYVAEYVDIVNARRHLGTADEGR